jgi:formylmethanofuran dehydrogenase subunit E
MFFRIGKVIAESFPKIRSIYLDEVLDQEYIVVRFVGGAISVRNATNNSLTANIAELGKLLNCGYYDEVEHYKKLKKKEWYTRNISIDEETFDIDEIVECPQCGNYELKDEMVTIKGVDICRSCKVDV